MMEYIFFDDRLRAKFVEFLSGLGLEYRETADEMGMVVQVSEDLEDGTTDAIEKRYEELMQEQAEFLEETDERLEKNAAGVSITLSDGRPCMVRIAPDMMARLLGCLSVEELHELVIGIARSVENPDNSPLCHTLSDR
jgi:hypothetical protein